MRPEAPSFPLEVDWFPVGPHHYLHPLFSPASVALIGASARPGSLGRIVYENLLTGRFQGTLFAVNPNHRKVLGQPAFPSIAAIPQVVDLAIICAPPEGVPAILTEARGRARAALILSGAPTATSADYQRWWREIATRARSLNLPVVGPASFGVIRTSIGLNATHGAVSALPGRLTLISQSGAVCSALLDFARNADIGFASVVALGAVAGLDFGELLDYALADPECDSIVLYIEGLRDARAFLSSLRAAARTKPVIVLKAGRQPGDDMDALDPDIAFDAALKRAGTVRVNTYAQLFAAARMLSSGRIPPGNRLAIVSNGRGPGLLAADQAQRAGVELANLSLKTRTALSGMLQPEGRIVNPVDVRGEASPRHFAEAVRLALADENTDGVLLLHVTVPAASATDTARAIASMAKDARKPLLAAWLGVFDQPETRGALKGAGVINFFTPETAVDGFSYLAAYRRNQAWLLETPPPQPELSAPDMVAAERIFEGSPSSTPHNLDSVDATALLAAFGIPSAPVANAATTELASSRRARIALRTDPVFGPLIGYGSAEAPLSQMAWMLPPLNRRLAVDLIAAARVAGSPADAQPLVAVLLEMSALACALPWIVSLDVDLMVTPLAAIAGDVRARADTRRRPLAAGYRHMAIHPYPVELEGRLTLSSGATLEVRPIRPEDAAMEMAFVAGMSQESRYRRFMQHLPGLTPQMLARFTQVDYDRELALVALDGVPPAQAIVGVARYVANPDHESAEFAIAVTDAWQGSGLGRALLQRLVDCARAREFRRIVGSILAINAPMVKLAEKLGFVVVLDPEDPQQMIATLEFPRSGIY